MRLLFSTFMGEGGSSIRLECQVRGGSRAEWTIKYLKPMARFQDDSGFELVLYGGASFMGGLIYGGPPLFTITIRIR